jgi:exodeoxyribonuclease VII large subunit
MTADRETALPVRPVQLLASIEEAVVAAWPHPVWLTGEVDRVNTSGRNVHLTLIDENSHLRVVAIGLDAQRVKGRLAQAGVVLERGASIRVYGKVHIYPLRGDVELRAIDIDTAIGVGEAETHRRRTVEVVHKLGLADRQRNLPTPVAPLRIGIVTPGGQGWEDFAARMRMTPWAWDLRVLFTPSEGLRAAESVGRAVRTLSAELDVVVITRGGGSGVTAAYDSPSVALSVCQSSCPVIVAVGHASDTTVAEQVAWRRESTPTAAAVTLDRMLAAQRDDLVKEMTAAVDDADQLVRIASRELETEWMAFRLDLERCTAHTARASTAIGGGARRGGLSANGWRLVTLVAVLMLAVAAVLAVLL